MKRDPKAFLYEIIEAADAIAMAVAGLTFENYKASRLIRSSVEREFILIGEVLSKLPRVDSALFASIKEGPSIISFRNKLTHEYRTIDHVLVWGVMMELLPTLVLFRDFYQLRDTTHGACSGVDSPPGANDG